MQVENKETETLNQEKDKKYVMKWVLTEKLRVEMNEIDRKSPTPRTFIFKDFGIFFICYLIPPLIFFLNKFADYPLNFQNYPFSKFIYNRYYNKGIKGEEGKEIYQKNEEMNRLFMKFWVIPNFCLLIIVILLTVSTNFLHRSHSFILIERFGFFFF